MPMMTFFKTKHMPCANDEGFFIYTEHMPYANDVLVYYTEHMPYVIDEL